MEITNLLSLLAHLAVLVLNLKLYTEVVLKDKSQDNRQRQIRHVVYMAAVFCAILFAICRYGFNA